MTKTAILILSQLVLVLALAACGLTAQPSSTQASTSEAIEPTASLVVSLGDQFLTRVALRQATGTVQTATAQFLVTQSPPNDQLAGEVRATSTPGIPEDFEPRILLKPLQLHGSGVVQSARYQNVDQQVSVRTLTQSRVHHNDDSTAPVGQTNLPGSAVLSMNGEFVATSEGVSRLTDSTPLMLFEHDQSSVFPLTFSPLGKYIAIYRIIETSSFRYETSVEVWDLNSKKLFLEFDNYDSIAFSNDEMKIALGDTFRSAVQLVELPGGTQKYELPLQDFGLDIPSGTSDIAFSSDGRIVAIGLAPGDYFDSEGGTIQIHSVGDGRLLRIIDRVPDIGSVDWGVCDEPSFGIHPPAPPSAAEIMFSPDGRLLGVVYSSYPPDPFAGKHGYLYRLSDGSRIRDLGGGLTSIDFSSDGKRLLLAYVSGEVIEQSLVDGTVLSRFDGYNAAVVNLEYSLDSKHLAVQTTNRILLMDVLGAQPQRIHDGVSFSFSQDSSSYAVAYSAGSIERWDAAQDVRDQVLGGDPSGVSALTFTPDGGIISSSFDCQTYLWDASSGERSLQFEPAWGEGLTDHRLLRFDQLLLMRNQDVLIGNSRNGQSAIWNVSDGSVLRLSRESERFLAASSNGEFVALQREGSILLANGIDATNETHVAVDRSTLTAAAFSTDGSIFLTGERNYNLEAFSSTLKLFDASSGDLLALEELPAEEITAVAITPDHHYVAVAYRDGTYQLFAVHELGG